VNTIESVILRRVSRVMIPVIQLFGIYVVLHGHLSPGGGFAGGTILGVSLILYRFVFGKRSAKRRFPPKVLTALIGASLSIYGVMKGYSFLSGGSHLNWPMPPHGVPGNIFSGGFLLPLNIVVGVVVAITMYFFYGLFDEGEL
jgi:multicomponent Na+:H+ antiporter subunit B